MPLAQPLEKVRASASTGRSCQSSRVSTSTSTAPVIATSSSYVVEKTAAGWPAAAQTTSYCRSHGSIQVRTGAGWSMGETPPMTWPVCSAYELGVGALEPADADALGGGRGVDAVGARGEDQDRLAAGVEEQAVGDRADLAAERRGGECGGVDAVGQDDHVTGAAAPGVLVSKSGDRRVLGRHDASLATTTDDPQGSAWMARDVPGSVVNSVRVLGADRGHLAA